MNRPYGFLFIFLITFTEAKAAVPIYTLGIESNDLSPIVATDHPGKLCEGYACEIFERFANRKKFKFEYVSLPVKRMHAEFWEGKLDFAFPDNPEWSLKDKENLKIIYSDPLLSFEDAVFVTPEQVGQGIEKIKVLATPRGFTLWKLQPLVDAKKLRIEEAPTPEASIQMMLTGRVDAVSMPRQIINYHLAKMNRVGTIVPDPDLMPMRTSYYYLSSIQHPQVIHEFNLFLKKEEAWIRRLKQKNGL